jgi:hypothetical protein
MFYVAIEHGKVYQIASYSDNNAVMNLSGFYHLQSDLLPNIQNIEIKNIEKVFYLWENIKKGRVPKWQRQSFFL